MTLTPHRSIVRNNIAMQNTNDNDQPNPSPSEPTPTTGNYVIVSALRTLKILEAFGTPPHSFSLADIVALTGIDKGQAFRSLKTLEEAGFLSADQATYTLTGKIVRLSRAVLQLQTPSLTEASRSYMDQLHADTGETLHLFIRSGDFAVCIDTRESRHTVRVGSILGTSIALNAGAVPKAILANLPEQELDHYLANMPGATRYTDRTLMDQEPLRAELALIRERGYSISDEDFDADARGVGAAIFDAAGTVIGGISVGGPSSRITDALLADFSQQISSVASLISLRLGHLVQPRR